MNNPLLNAVQEKKQILYISYDGMTDPLGQSQILPYICGLSANGYAFTLISCEKKARFQAGKDVIENICRENNIHWVPLFYTKKPPILSTLKDVFSIWQKAVSLHKQKNFAMVHTRIGIPSVVGLRLKKKYGIKFFHDIRGFYADDRVDGGMWNLKNPVFRSVYHYFKKHEQACLQYADAITCLTFKARKIFHEAAPANANVQSMAVIPCAVDTKLFDPARITAEEQQLLRARFGFEKEDQVFSYLGSIGGWYLTQDMIRLLGVIYQHIPKAKFLFISPDRHHEIKQMCLQAGMPDTDVHTVYAKRSEIPALLSLSAFSVFFIKACYSKQAASPTKHGEIMSMGIPVISNSGVGDVDEIINTYKSGILIPELTDDAYQKAITEIKSFNKDEAAIRQGAIEFYSLDKALAQYLAIYKNTLTD
ncbi:glycosyltransferase [Mucilaginibacter sp. Bleaf8]|uniref:glycosyltransferase n=1 Tax=Mucilaginibacter sp. Bleaf8 TaxID=2834430 RepID=UPI001BCE25F5|nr:glycosyltransferase [Mucilaginibacter sp. Bleaf8]MBS7563842.1 glycosyltransferase [Mucilaginibacter sp. Bleaf8]